MSRSSPSALLLLAMRDDIVSAAIEAPQRLGDEPSQIL